jgi:vacuolar-type H+-ATPase subunit I/STV1
LKLWKIVFIFLFFFTINSYSENINNNKTAQEIKSLIEKVKNAPPEEKYKYMNQLKIIIRNLHSEERKKVIKQIMKELKSEKSRKHQEHLMKGNRKEKFHKLKEKFNERNIDNDRLKEIKRKIRERKKRREHQ